VFLFILESIGTQELILIGLVALIFLGPRKLPEIARKVGKVMADLRSTTNEFRSTWEREVDLETESKALSIDSIEEEARSVARKNTIAGQTESLTPEVRSIDKESFDRLAAGGAASAAPGDPEPAGVSTEPERPADDQASDEAAPLSDKRSWL
jgi:Tat protein translocase TatB subunit